ncbi:unnamed protein product [Penicillium salamii]|uniref:C2H2-type domain-containing protein n=1 Tax=Penicillium salamii TaxID=1612424 RepID=A0A9W4NZT6_9EURO|nr:unnamed protein product [Penicillium salamii]CAG8291698.1 unnamed protein product [Penicillium salamii]CAG8315225.1 unnamed protein product [Penicillium salamii]CAG8351054.1 unnamed protein product [Penicillium salamii]CAG8428545.1 unnamed protein product [Penicillium salamii]
MAFCSSCNRSFRSETSLDQHIKDSPAHAIKFYCGLCSIWLLDIDALEEHIRTSPPHSAPTRNTSKFKCDICSTTFVSQNFLNDHLQYSPLNATSFAHKLYSLVYLTRKELEENLQNLQAHTPNFQCKSCTRLFNDQSALDRHLQSSSAHTPTFECDPCDRSFVSQDALDAHIQSSKAHAGERHGVPLQGYRSNPTPLDIFFAYYTSFKYDPTLPPSVSYAKLVDFYDWDRNDPEARTARREYQNSLEDEVRLWFGSESDLASWHSLCRAVGIEPLPRTCNAARVAIRNVYVNIVDLIHWARMGLGDRPVHRFKNIGELSEYTKLTNKFYSCRGPEKGEDNVVLRHLLRHILS